ncbi:unnamed protein product [Arabis nemorensis]|uniref:Uncharacterized protein n=1 Tax=Arabis nemorensis TaxID=586526 RepID=A0A565BSP3_9BRAS|nr:unnamed protein product [Arabis nemorensis]
MPLPLVGVISQMGLLPPPLVLLGPVPMSQRAMVQLALRCVLIFRCDGSLGSVKTMCAADWF